MTNKKPRSQKAAAKSRMSVEDVRARVAEIETATVADDALGHMEADDLLIDVLQAIADGASSPAKLAREALKVENIGVVRRFE